MWKLSYRLTKMFNTVENKGPLKVALTIKNRIEKFKINLPFIQIFCNPGLKQRHWQSMNQALGIYITPNEDTSLKDFLEKSKIIEKNLDSLTAISEQARKEFALEQALKRMKNEWNNVTFTFIPYKETDFYLFSSFEEFQTLLDDQMVKTNTIKNSPFVMPFEKEVNFWINDLQRMEDSIDFLTKIQSAWIYLEPIFGSEDIRSQIPVEGKMFEEVDSIWYDLAFFFLNFNNLQT